MVTDMKIIKPAAFALSGFALLTTPVSAGNLAEPIMEPEVITEAATGTGGGWVVPLVLLALVAAVVASSGGSDTPVPVPPVME
jgi:hypothetical protein